MSSPSQPLSRVSEPEQRQGLTGPAVSLPRQSPVRQAASLSSPRAQPARLTGAAAGQPHRRGSGPADGRRTAGTAAANAALGQGGLAGARATAL